MSLTDEDKKERKFWRKAYAKIKEVPAKYIQFEQLKKPDRYIYTLALSKNISLDVINRPGAENYYEVVARNGELPLISWGILEDKTWGKGQIAKAYENVSRRYGEYQEKLEDDKRHKDLRALERALK